MLVTDSTHQSNTVQFSAAEFYGETRQNYSSLHTTRQTKITTASHIFITGWAIKTQGVVEHSDTLKQTLHFLIAMGGTTN